MGVISGCGTEGCGKVGVFMAQTELSSFPPQMSFDQALPESCRSHKNLSSVKVDSEARQTADMPPTAIVNTVALCHLNLSWFIVIVNDEFMSVPL